MLFVSNVAIFCSLELFYTYPMLNNISQRVYISYTASTVVGQASRTALALGLPAGWQCPPNGTLALTLTSGGRVSGGPVVRTFFTFLSPAAFVAGTATSHCTHESIHNYFALYLRSLQLWHLRGQLMRLRPKLDAVLLFRLQGRATDCTLSAITAMENAEVHPFFMSTLVCPHKVLSGLSSSDKSQS